MLQLHRKTFKCLFDHVIHLQSKIEQNNKWRKIFELHQLNPDKQIIWLTTIFPIYILQRSMFVCSNVASLIYDNKYYGGLVFFCFFFLFTTSSEGFANRILKWYYLYLLLKFSKLLSWTTDLKNLVTVGYSILGSNEIFIGFTLLIFLKNLH